MAMEVEIKRILEEAGYRRLLATLGQPERVEQQTNVYLDSAAQELQAQKAMLRLRTIGPRTVATLKCRAQLADGVSRAVEMEQEVALHPVTMPTSAVELGVAGWFGPGLTLPTPDPQTPLHAVGQMHTQRHVFPAERAGLAAGLWLELDRTRFETRPGHPPTLRWELECEVPDPEATVARLDAWLAAHGVAVIPAQETKYAQFLRLRAG